MIQTYDIHQARKMLQIGKNKMYELVQLRQITHSRIGRKIRFMEEDILKYLKSVREY